MFPGEIHKWVDAVEPEKAALTLADVLSRLFPLLEEETRLKLLSILRGGHHVKSQIFPERAQRQAVKAF